MLAPQQTDGTHIKKRTYIRAACVWGRSTDIDIILHVACLSKKQEQLIVGETTGSCIGNTFLYWSHHVMSKRFTSSCMLSSLLALPLDHEKE